MTFAIATVENILKTGTTGSFSYDYFYHHSFFLYILLLFILLFSSRVIITRACVICQKFCFVTIDGTLSIDWFSRIHQ